MKKWQAEQVEQIKSLQISIVCKLNMIKEIKSQKHVQ